MKKRIAMILSLVLLVGSIAACGGSSDSSDSSTTDSSEAAESEETTEEAAEETADIDYPTKNVNVIVPYGAGGNTDMSIRALLNTVTEEVDDSFVFVVDNKTGNGGLIGMEALAESDADGYTLGATAVDLMMHMCFGRTEKTMDDYIPIAATMADPYAIVISSSNENYSTLEEFVEYAQANPGKIKVGDTGSGGAPNVAAKAFEMYFDVTFDIYSYDGSADCITAIESGEIDATFTQPSPAVASLGAGTLSMIGVLSDERLSGFPDCPTVTEVYGEDHALVMKGWVALTAPAGTPDEIVDLLSEKMGAALQTEAYQEQIESLGMEYMVLYGDELTTFLDEQMAFYEEVCPTISID